MTAYRLTARARRDILRIWSYIAEDSQPAADRFVDLLIQHFQLLGANANIAVVATSCGRVTEVSRWRTFDSLPIGQPGVRIMHVVHGRRDLLALLRI